MTTFWNTSTWPQITGGHWHRGPHQGTLANGICINSREVQSGQAFLALAGEKFDGHDFLPQAVAAGASLLIVQRLPEAIPPHTPILVVRNTVQALQSLATAYRQSLSQAGVKVIGVVGSNGKTSTRNLIHQVLSARLTGTQSPRSFNNHLGVPLTLLAAGLTDDFVVAEIGTNHPGEIASLCRIARPDLLVMTSIGREHMEFFGTLDGVAEEETASFAYLQDHGLAILPGDAPTRLLLEPYLNRLDPTTKRIWVSLDEPTGDLWADAILPDDQATAFRLHGWGPAPIDLRLPLIGRHNVANALSAAAVARHLGLNAAAVKQALAGVAAMPMRLEIQRYGSFPGITLLNDAYNANPESMIAGIGTLAQMPLVSGGRRIAILGDMRELGEQSPDLHRQVGHALAEQTQPPIDHAILIGPLALYIAEALGRSWPPTRYHLFPGWSDDLPGQIASLLKEGDRVLIKASRGSALERLIPAIAQRFPTPPSSATAKPLPGQS